MCARLSRQVVEIRIPHQAGRSKAWKCTAAGTVAASRACSVPGLAGLCLRRVRESQGDLGIRRCGKGRVEQVCLSEHYSHNASTQCMNSCTKPSHNRRVRDFKLPCFWTLPHRQSLCGEHASSNGLKYSKTLKKVPARDRGCKDVSCGSMQIREVGVALRCPEDSF